MQAASATFKCQKCGKAYDWTPEIVGKTAKCPCGAVLKIPSAPPGSEEAKKEIAFKDPNPGCLLSPPATAAAAKSSNVEPQSAEAAIMNLYGPVAPVEPRKRAPMEVPDEELDPKLEAELKELAEYGEQDAAKPNAYLDVKLPLILLGFGLMLVFGEVSYVSHRDHSGLVSGLFGAVIGIIINIVLIIIGLMAAAKIAGINFGPIFTAILKISAIYLAPTTLGSLVTAVLGGDMAVSVLGWCVSVVLYWALLSYLFQLDGHQTMICVFCIGMLRLLATMLLVGAMLTAMGGGGGHLVDEIDSQTQTITE